MNTDMFRMDNNIFSACFYEAYLYRSYRSMCVYTERVPCIARWR